ncbi:hypothetical protein ACIQNU_17835 [Streptomyces sp. NPDC091292]|uniref:hypothetical protein n=1 Tax=Streptomyces sp. NPDC091292 TaxID=3365991 RepID=UPI00382FC08A
MTSISGTGTPLTGMDLTGFTEREQGVWTDARGLVVSVHFFPLVPDLPARLDEPERLLFGLAQNTAGVGGGLIEAEFGAVDRVPAVRQLIKVPRPGGPGQVFLGSWTVPKAGCSTVLKVQAGEGATTGFREATVLAQVGPADYFRPHPYATGLQGGLPYHVGDHEGWDPQFPDHPLTLVRATLRRITPTVTFDERFKVLPPFAGPTPPPAFPASPTTDAPTTKRGWFRRRDGQ